MDKYLNKMFFYIYGGVWIRALWAHPIPFLLFPDFPFLNNSSKEKYPFFKKKN